MPPQDRLRLNHLSSTEGIEQAKAKSRDNEQIHGGNVRRVVPQKGAPSLTWRSTPLDHVLGDARLRDLKPELEQFAMDTWRSPKRVLDAHLPDQRAKVRLDLRPPSRGHDFPSPPKADISTIYKDISSTDESSISSVVIFTCQPILRPNEFLSNDNGRRPRSGPLRTR